jgi:3-oxoacyl-[acyl-carrier protein] reductase
VIVNYATSREGAEQTVEEIVKAGGQAWAVQGDFSKPEEITRTFAEIETKHGKLDVLVNNAGVAGFGPLERVTAEEFHRLFNLNVLGLLLSTKAAVNNISISLSKELGPKKIRVNALNPELVITEGLRAGGSWKASAMRLQ